MPRVYLVKKTRKDQGTCGYCGCEIRKGDAYRYWEFRYGGRRIRCMKPECTPKPRDLTQSEFWVAVYSAQETDFHSAACIEDLESAKDDAVSQLEEIGNECEDKLNNIPDSLQQGPTGELLQERIDALGEVVSNLEGVDITFEGEDPEELTQKEGESDEDFVKRKAAAEADPKQVEKRAALKERIEEIADELDTTLSDISCS